MELYRIALLVQEFPFLAEVARLTCRKLKHFGSINVERGDNALLARRQCCVYGQDGNRWYDVLAFFAVVGEKVIPLPGPETLGEKLFEKGLTVDFIVEDGNSASPGLDNNLRIHKMRGFDLAAYHAARIDEAAAALKAEIAAVCAA